MKKAVEIVKTLKYCGGLIFFLPLILVAKIKKIEDFGNEDLYN